ncbi:hypothetical protein C7M84_009517 [Penaeus vannamei]|uniref:Uncharacterized protein n=1 Tax=Penaeus vannamei TaxID=6689 RepID=A0A423T6I5_PENVA|nr:hypothetical protein C7M84_009517 [Penaeus vannamei]
MQPHPPSSSHSPFSHPRIHVPEPSPTPQNTDITSTHPQTHSHHPSVHLPTQRNHATPPSAPLHNAVTPDFYSSLLTHNHVMSKRSHLLITPVGLITPVIPYLHGTSTPHSPATQSHHTCKSRTALEQLLLNPACLPVPPIAMFSKHLLLSSFFFISFNFPSFVGCFDLLPLLIGLSHSPYSTVGFLPVLLDVSFFLSFSNSLNLFLFFSLTLSVFFLLYSFLSLFLFLSLFHSLSLSFCLSFSFLLNSFLIAFPCQCTLLPTAALQYLVPALSAKDPGVCSQSSPSSLLPHSFLCPSHFFSLLSHFPSSLLPHFFSPSSLFLHSFLSPSSLLLLSFLTPSFLGVRSRLSRCRLFLVTLCDLMHWRIPPLHMWCSVFR